MSFNPVVIYRVNGGFTFGMGHVMRSLSIAEEVLTPLGIQSYFLLKGDESGRELILKRGFEVHLLSPGSEQDELQEMKRLISTNKPSFVITDVQTMEKKGEYETLLASCQLPHIVFDDLFISGIKGDIIINSSLHKSVSPPSDKTNFMMKYLTDPDYTIIRKQFRDVVKCEEKKEERKGVVTLSFGGSDPQNHTQRVLKVVSCLNNVQHIQIVIGPAFQNVSLIETIAGYDRKRIKVFRHVASIAELFITSDIIFLSGGVTLYEGAFLGVPMITLCQTDKENRVAKEFEKRGAAINLGYQGIADSRIREVFTVLLSDEQLKQDMSEKGKALVDGQGVARIKEEFKKVVKCV